MGWVTLISALLQVFGPILAEALKKWLDRRLHDAAARIDFAAYPSEHAARDALFTTARAYTWNPVHKLFLRRLQKHAARLSVTSESARGDFALPDDVAQDLLLYAEAAAAQPEVASAA